MGQAIIFEFRFVGGMVDITGECNLKDGTIDMQSQNLEVNLFNGVSAQGLLLFACS